MDTTRKRKPGRPKTTWWRTVERELREIGLTLGEAGKLAKDRDRWQRINAALNASPGVGNEDESSDILLVHHCQCFVCR